MNATKRALFGRRRGNKLPPRAMGLIAMSITAIVVFASFHTDQLTSLVTPHETVKVEFPRQFKLVAGSPFTSKVKIAGVIVGEIGDIERTARNTALVTLNVDNGTRAKLGSTPSAAIVAKLVVAGNYYVDLIPGGFGPYRGDVIPPERTRLPVELEDVLGAVSTPQALKGIQSSIVQPDKTLAQGGRQATTDLISHAPSTLRPAGAVLTGLRGTQPDTDLTTFVRGFESTATAFNLKQDRVDKIITSLDSTTEALKAGSQPLSDSIATGADTLRVTRAGLADLQPTLDQLTVTGENFRDAAKRLDPFLRKFNPVLDRARPVISDLRDVTRDLRPVVDRLVPTASKATDTLDNVRGPVLDRLNGRIQKVLYAPWHGTGTYQGGGADNPMSKELGYLMANLSSVFAYHDGNVSLGRLHAAFGGRSIGGQNTPMSLEQYFEKFGMQQPPGPQEGAKFKDPLAPFTRSVVKPGTSLLSGAPKPSGGLPLPLGQGGR